MQDGSPMIYYSVFCAVVYSWGDMGKAIVAYAVGALFAVISFR